jgi:glycosyltransferase involved in cell wall biosynthesis
VINEAFNQGVPVIASDAVGAAAGGFVRDGFNGYIVPEQNSLELSIALQRILEDESLRDRLSNAARQTVAQWDNERMVAGFLDAIRFVAR